MIELAVAMLADPDAVNGVCGLGLDGYAREYEEHASFLRYDIEWPEGTMSPVIVLQCDSGEAVGWLDPDGVIEMIDVWGAGAPVGQGLNVGVTIDELRAAFPENGRLICGLEEAGFISFATGRNEVHMFDVRPWYDHIDEDRCDEIPGDTPTNGYRVYPASW